ncbi:hypothetical protein WME97_00085 [Sorangium sp. So ce367]|uniref:hypothetical protein n=1 Tax=Sorangium sp. So ce367 TaxID=3133305 RepID=UPI003F5F6A6C
MRSQGAGGNAAQRLRWAAAWAVGASAAFAAGCSPNRCDRSEEANPPIEFVEATPEGGIYETSAPDGELLYFPGGMRYALKHHLGARPRWWQVYLSFERDGTKSGGTLAQAAGNQAEVPCVDDQHLIVVNGSCSEYWLRVVAGGAIGADDGATGAAGGGADGDGDGMGAAGGTVVGRCFGDGADPGGGSAAP